MLFVTVVYSFPPMLLFSYLDENTLYEQVEVNEKAEKLSIDTPNGKIAGWSYHNEDENIPLILYFSGNAESSASRILYLENVELKPLILQSESDEIVKYESAKRLSKEYKNECEFVTINGIYHNAYWDNLKFLRSIEDYLEKLNINISNFL